MNERGRALFFALHVPQTQEFVFAVPATPGPEPSNMFAFAWHYPTRTWTEVDVPLVSMFGAVRLRQALTYDYGESHDAFPTVPYDEMYIDTLMDLVVGTEEGRLFNWDSNAGKEYGSVNERRMALVSDILRSPGTRGSEIKRIEWDVREARLGYFIGVAGEPREESMTWHGSNGAHTGRFEDIPDTLHPLHLSDAVRTGGKYYQLAITGIHDQQTPAPRVGSMRIEFREY